MRRARDEDAEEKEQDLTALGIFNLQLHARGWQTGLTVKDIHSYGLSHKAPMLHKPLLSYVQQRITHSLEQFPLDQHMTELREQGRLWLYAAIDAAKDADIFPRNPRALSTPDLVESWIHSSKSTEWQAVASDAAAAWRARAILNPGHMPGYEVELLNSSYLPLPRETPLYSVPGHTGVYQALPATDIGEDITPPMLLRVHLICRREDFIIMDVEAGGLTVLRWKDGFDTFSHDVEVDPSGFSPSGRWASTRHGDYLLECNTKSPPISVIRVVRYHRTGQFALRDPELGPRSWLISGSALYNQLSTERTPDYRHRVVITAVLRWGHSFWLSVDSEEMTEPQLWARKYRNEDELPEEHWNEDELPEEHLITVHVGYFIGLFENDFSLAEQGRTRIIEP